MRAGSRAIRYHGRLHPCDIVLALGGRDGSARYRYLAIHPTRGRVSTIARADTPPREGRECVALSGTMKTEFSLPFCENGKEKMASGGENYRVHVAPLAYLGASVLSRLRIARKSSSRYEDNRNFLDRLARECQA